MQRSPSKKSSRQFPSTSLQDLGSGVIVGGIGVAVGEIGVLVSGIGVVDGAAGVAGGAPHLIRSITNNVEPITHCNNFWYFILYSFPHGTTLDIGRELSGRCTSSKIPQAGEPVLP